MRFNFFAGVASFFYFTLAAAGNWSSGGGELIKDAHNPWFLENTKEVSYCIVVDEKNVSAPKHKIESLVRLAIDNWKKDFSKARTVERYYQNQLLQLKIATQIFKAVDCASNPDLRFQFGVLSRDQFQYLGTPTKYIGIAVRTDYDPVNLKGRGFIYISPDSGPLKYEDSQEFVENPWSYDGLLHKTIMHELGHVFGLQHSNRRSEVMSTQYLEQILGKDASPSYRRLDSLSSYLNIQLPDERESQYCASTDTPRTAERFFGAPDRDNCMLVRFENNRLHVYSAQHVISLDRSLDENVEFKWEPIGSAEIEKRHFGDDIFINSIVLNKQQKVFPVPFNAEWKILPAVLQRFEILRGTYENKSTNQKRRVALRASISSYLSMVGMLDGEIFVDLPYETDFIKKSK